VGKDKIPMTPALRALKSARADFVFREYKYEEKGGTGAAARQLGVDEHAVIKTLVMEDEDRHPLIILMHGDKEVSTKKLARFLGVKTVSPCDPGRVGRLTGYQIGGVSPFGVKRRMPIYIESTIIDLDKIYINGGKRGLLLEITPQVLLELLRPEMVNVAV